MWPFKEKLNPQHDALTAEYELFKVRMFSPRIETSDGMTVRTSVVPLLVNDTGRMAVTAARAWQGSTAIHEINQDGTFSKKPPYWLAHDNKQWKSRNEYALVSFAVAPEDTSFKSSNRDPRSKVHRIGIQVHELRTDWLPEMTFDQFKEWKVRAKFLR